MVESAVLPSAHFSPTTPLRALPLTSAPLSKSWMSSTPPPWFLASTTTINVEDTVSPEWGTTIRPAGRAQKQPRKTRPAVELPGHRQTVRQQIEVNLAT